MLFIRIVLVARAAVPIATSIELLLRPRNVDTQNTQNKDEIYFFQIYHERITVSVNF